jgi:hypothetical protein
MTNISAASATQERYTKLGLPGNTELNRLVLLRLGVPEAAVRTFGQENASTDDEAVALRAWTAEHHVCGSLFQPKFFSVVERGGSLIANLPEAPLISRSRPLNRQSIPVRSGGRVMAG